MQVVTPIEHVETETLLILSKISEQKKHLNDIFKKYKVDRVELIEDMIASGKIKEHPGYEDYLSALAYKQNIADLKEMLNNLIKKI
ncbi:MAG: hypothetical protein ACE5KE_08335 [Methanosarcinales archaeon]